MESNQYMPPVRKSLTDEELAVRVEYATSTKMGIEAMMDLVVAQEALRAQEDLEIQNWLEQMDAEGSPESISAAENFRKSLSGVTALPKVEPVAEPIVEEQASSFSWFTKPEVVEDEVEPIVDQVVEEEVELPVEQVVLEEATEEPVLEEEIPEVQEEVQSWSLVPSAVAEPVGTETEDEFEHLLASAAAEEELTALEESESESKAGFTTLGLAGGKRDCCAIGFDLASHFPRFECYYNFDGFGDWLFCSWNRYSYCKPRR